MSRPLRIEFPGAVYHVTSRGDRREPIYRNDQDRSRHLEVLEQAMDRYDAQVLAYCQMGDHFHLVLHTRQANLSRLMRHVNGVYSQAFNQRHGLAGHLYEGRFKAILVDRDTYLLPLCRYVERNPVAAGMVAAAGEWPWSSYRAHVGEVATPPWLDSDGLHAYLLNRPVATAQDRRRAAQRYAALVADARPNEAPIWQAGLRGQVYLGDESFVARMQALAAPALRAAVDVPKAQRKARFTLQDCLQQSPGQPGRALSRAYRECGMTMTAMAKELELSVSRVSRLIAAAECEVGARSKT